MSGWMTGSLEEGSPLTSPPLRVSNFLYVRMNDGLTRRGFSANFSPADSNFLYVRTDDGLARREFSANFSPAENK